MIDRLFVFLFLCITALLVVLSLAITDGFASQYYTRDPAQVRAFRKANACPATHKFTGACAGYVVDHKEPLDCGGLDAPSNMQWQTLDASRAKDKWERTGCLHGKRIYGKVIK